MINYQKILDKNLLNVLKDILKNIRDNGLSSNNSLYITFSTNHKNTELPDWIKRNYPEEMTIIIQYEYYNLIINKNSFNVTLSFNNIKTKIKIGFDAIISFDDPSANFALILKKNLIQKRINRNLKNNKSKTNNIIDFTSYKKN